MARKRYETAFIPTPFYPTVNSQQYADVGSLLFSIESLSIAGNRVEEKGQQARDKEGFLRRRSKSLNPAQRKSLPPDSTDVKYHEYLDHDTRDDKCHEYVPLQTHRHSHQNQGQDPKPLLEGTRSESPIRKMLPSRKKNIGNDGIKKLKSSSSIPSSSGCSSTTNSGSPFTSTNRRILNTDIGSGEDAGSTSSATTTTTIRLNNGPHRLQLNSSCSLDSLDSTQSEDFKYLSKGFQPPLPPSKLLSPISDKSPMEVPYGTNTSNGSNAMVIIRGGRDEIIGNSCWRKHGVGDLSNLPWEMPKLKRKLALLVDSGISLDYSCGSSGSSWSQTTDIPKSNFSDKIIKHGQYHPVMERSGSGENLSKTDQHEKILNTNEAYNVPPPSSSSTINVPFPPNNTQSSVKDKMIKPDRCKMTLDLSDMSKRKSSSSGYEQLIDPKVELEGQDWFHGAITRIEAEEILRPTREGSFLVRNCESLVYNRHSLSLKSSRGFIHIRIEPKSESGNYCLGHNDESKEFLSIPSLILHFMSHRLPMKGTEHLCLKYPVLTNFL